MHQAVADANACITADLAYDDETVTELLTSGDTFKIASVLLGMVTVTIRQHAAAVGRPEDDLWRDMALKASKAVDG